MRTKLLVFLAVLVVGGLLHADINDLQFFDSNGTFTAITGTEIVGAGEDDAWSSAVDFGFDFPFCDQTFTQFFANSNGMIHLGSATSDWTASQYSNGIGGTSCPNTVAVLWDDLETDTGNVQYTTGGTAPNRYVIVEWTNVHRLSAEGSLNFQAKMYETGNIELCYGEMTNSTTMSASIGVVDQTCGSGHFISVTPGDPVSISMTTANDAVALPVGDSGTTFTFSNAHGIITGTVTLNGGSGDVTEVLITAGDYTTHPIANGTYSMNAYPGTYTVTASLVGYTGGTVNNVVVTDGQTTSGINFTLQPNPMVTVTGQVVGSDNPGTGLVGAIVTLTGIDDFEATTGANGMFSIPNVWNNQTYALHVEYEGYEEYDGTITVGTSDYNCGVVTLSEFTSPPRNVVATQSNDFTTAYINWNSPNYSSGYMWDFEADNGEFTSDSAAGWGWGTDTTAGNHSPSNIWKTCLNGSYSASCNYNLTSPELEIGADFYLTFWHNINTENYFDGGNVKISIDGGATWTLITPDGGYPEDAMSTGNAAIPGEPGYTATSSGSWNGWTLASFDLSAYDGETALIKWCFGSDGSINYYGWAIDDVTVGQPEGRTQRVPLGYNVYRLTLGNEENPGTWTMLNTATVSDSSYTDTTWNALPQGLYEYAVKTAYVNGVESEPEFSNWLGKDYFTSCTVNVTAVSGDDVTGAEVTLTCQDADPDGVYRTYVDYIAAGTVTFPQVWKGTYSLVVALENYQPYEQTGIVIQTPTTINVDLSETTNPVNGLKAQVVANDVTLTWNEPADITFFDFEADNGEFVANDASGWQWGAETVQGVYSGTNCWSTVLNGQYNNNVSWTLDSPVIAVPGDAWLTFYHYMNCESGWDGGNVSVSVDGGSTFTVITPEGGYPSTGISGLGEPGYTGDTGGYVLATFNMSAYDGQEVVVRFHFGTDSSVNSYNGWCIDDFRLGPAEDRTREQSREQSTVNRVLEHFTVYRNGTQIAEVEHSMTPDEGYVFLDNDLPDGDYNYEVVANYTTGNSEGVFVACQVYPINISGYVNLSDTGAGVTGATVTVQNDLYYFETTTTNGNFMLTDVNGMQTYNVTVHNDGYTNFDTEITAVAADIVMSTPAAPITLVEIINPPVNVTAVENGAGTQVTVSWNSPGHGQSGWLEWDDGINNDSIGTGGAAEFYIASRWTADDLANYAGMPLSKIAFFPAVDCTYGIAVWAGGSYDGTNFDAGELIASQDVESVTIGEWNEVTFDSPASIPGGSEMWFGVYVNTSSGYPAGCDAGPQVATFGNLIQWEGTWCELTDLNASLTYNWNLKGYAGSARDGYVAIQHHASSVTPMAERQNRIDNQGTLSNCGYTIAVNKTETTVNTTQVRDVTRHNAIQNRSLEYYKIWRLAEGEESTPNVWDALDMNVDDTTYVDTAWGSLEANVYRYAVKAVYTNDFESTASLSNLLPHNMIKNLTLHVTTNSGDSPLGVAVDIINQDGNPEHQYSVTIPASGTLIVPVWMGIYDITATKTFFADYENSNLLVDEDMTLEIEMTELLNPVYNLAADVNGGDVTLTWISPYEAGDEFTESFEGGDTPDGWEIIQTCTDNTHPTPTWWTVTDYANDGFTPPLVPSDGSYHCGLWWGNEYSNEWLITPEFQCGANTQFSFTSYVYFGSTWGDHYYVKVSSDGGENWDILWDASELTPAGWNGYGDPYVIDLSSYVGSQIKVALQAVAADDNTLYAVWFVDELTVASDGRVLHFTNNDMTRSGEEGRVENNQRTLEGYQITRNGVVIQEQWTSTTFTDQDLASGTYTYLVKAVYTTGNSPALSVTAVSADEPGTNNYVTTLKGNSPNPFNPVTAINYSIATPGDVSIEVYNLRGQKVTTLVNEFQAAGNHSVTWNGTDSNGHASASGVYFYKMKSGTYTSTKKMIMLK